ncbi:hypothetical protein SeLEV6574_g07518, partial [Synchytrium endobioticum]
EGNHESCQTTLDTSRDLQHQVRNGKLGLDHPITNIHTVLGQVNDALNTGDPSLEFIFVEPYTSKIIYKNKLGINLRPFGHAALRYTLPDAKDTSSAITIATTTDTTTTIVDDAPNSLRNYNPNTHHNIENNQVLINITKIKGQKLIKFFNPSEFLYGIGEDAYEQGGCYSRHVVGIRIERIAKEKILLLHKYFEGLSERAHAAGRRHDVGFSTACGPLTNRLRTVLPTLGGLQLRERGNCCRWVSKGLQAAHLIKHSRMYPLDLFIELLTTQSLHDPNNVHVVYYERIPHAFHRWGESYGNAHSVAFGALTIPGLYRTWKYRKPWEFAHVIVRVPDGQETAIIEKVQPPERSVVKSSSRTGMSGGGISMMSPTTNAASTTIPISQQEQEPVQQHQQNTPPKGEKNVDQPTSIISQTSNSTSPLKRSTTPTRLSSVQWKQGIADSPVTPGSIRRPRSPPVVLDGCHESEEVSP